MFKYDNISAHAQTVKQVFIKRPFLIQESGLNRTTNQAQYLIYVEIQPS